MSNQPSSKLSSAFLTIWIGQAFSLFGSRLVQFALVWYLTQRTGSATILATATMAAMLPQIVLGPFIGALVDRWNRRAIMIGADAAIALATGLLVVLFSLDAVQIWHVYVIMFIRSLGQSFHEPAMAASTPLMVGEEHLARVSGFNQMLQGLMAIIAPILGALLLGLLPMQGVLAVDIVTAAVAIGTLLAVTVPQPSRVGEAAKTSAFADMVEGFRYVWGWTGLMILLAGATLLNMLFVPAFSLLPILVTGHFNGGVVQLGWFEAALGVGFVAGGLLLGVWGGFKRRILTSMVGLVAAGIFMGIVGLLPGSQMIAAIAAIGVVGMTMPIINGPVFAIFQATVAPEKQGRVFALVGALSAGVSPLGLLVAGPVADRIGVQAWFLVGGAFAVIMTLLLGLLPAVRNFEEQGRDNGGMLRSDEVGEAASLQEA